MRMSNAEIQEWWILYQMAPWGDERADLRMGIQASSLVNMWTAKGKRVEPSDFIPDFYKPHTVKSLHPQQSAAQMMQVLMQGTKKAGGVVK